MSFVTLCREFLADMRERFHEFTSEDRLEMQLELHEIFKAQDHLTI
jgi:hypothetical protein